MKVKLSSQRESDQNLPTLLPSFLHPSSSFICSVWPDQCCSCCLWCLLCSAISLAPEIPVLALPCRHTEGQLPAQNNVWLVANSRPNLSLVQTKARNCDFNDLKASLFCRIKESIPPYQSSHITFPYPCRCCTLKRIEGSQSATKPCRRNTAVCWKESWKPH